MRMARMAMMVTALFAAAAICGCATGPKGPTDEELIKTTVDKFCASLLAKNIEEVGTTLSPDFYHPEVGDKEGALQMLQQGVDSGYLDDGKIETADMQIAIEADKATAYPLVASSPAGSATVGLSLQKDKDGNWLITELNVEGI